MDARKLLETSWSDSLQYKLVTAFIAVSLLVVIASAGGIFSVGLLTDQVQNVEERSEEERAVNEVQYNLERMQNALLRSDLQPAEAQVRFDAADERFNSHGLQPIEQSDAEWTNEHDDLTDDILDAYWELNAVADEYFEARENGDEKTVIEKREEAGELIDELDQNRVELEQAAEQEVDNEVAAAITLGDRAETTGIIFSILSLLIAIGIGMITAKHITNPVTTLSNNATQIANGNLDTEIRETTRTDEVGELNNAFGDIQNYLQKAGLQANAIASGDFDSHVHDETIPGDFGKSLNTMRSDIQTYISKAETAQQDAEELANSLEENAVEFGDVMQDAADGDLTRRMPTTAESDAMEQIFTSYNEMMDELDTTLTEVNVFADKVASTSTTVTNNAAEIKESNEQVSSSITSISDDTSKQRENLNEVSNEIASLSATIEEAASSAQEVAQKSDETATIAEDGRENAEKAIDNVTEVEESIENTVENVEELEALMNEINNVVEVIQSIAEQTNILALNASIEAARVGGGSDGKSDGFAVVANEVKQLAEETKQSAENVGELIEDVQTQTTRTVNEIQDAQETVKQTTESVDDAVTAFVGVAENVKDTDAGIQEISNAMDDQAVSTEESVSMVEDIADKSHDIANETNDVSAAAKQQNTSMKEVTTSITQLSEQATQLQDTLDQFTLNK